jgi:hypothetical protein
MALTIHIVGAIRRIGLRTGGHRVIDLTVDLHTTLWTVKQAAQAAGVSENAVHNWRYRGRLEISGRDRKGRPLFRAIDVIRAEKATRERARRAYAAQAA